MFLYIDEIKKTYGHNEVLKGISFSFERGEFVSIIGPSGTGKTTLLKIIAGIEAPSGGSIRFSSDQHAQSSPPLLVFQDYMLFPFLNVFENVAFGLRARKLKQTEINERTSSILSFFQLEEKASEYPARLSGGQQQRVALARALVLQPELLLLDEPYANLDRNLKLDTARFIRETQREFGISTLCVTHDIEEALASSDTIGIMLDGSIVDYGPPEQVYTRPSTLESARFLGELNTLPSSLFSIFDIEESCPAVYSRTEALEIAAVDCSTARIVDKKFLGTAYQYKIMIAGTELTSRSMNGELRRSDYVQVNLKSYLRPDGTALKPIRDREVENSADGEREDETWRQVLKDAGMQENALSSGG